MHPTGRTRRVSESQCGSENTPPRTVVSRCGTRTGQARTTAAAHEVRARESSPGLAFSGYRAKPPGPAYWSFCQSTGHGSFIRRSYGCRLCEMESSLSFDAFSLLVDRTQKQPGTHTNPSLIRDRGLSSNRSLTPKGRNVSLFVPICPYRGRPIRNAIDCKSRRIELISVAKISSRS